MTDPQVLRAATTALAVTVGPALADVPADHVEAVDAMIVVAIARAETIGSKQTARS